MKMLKIEDNRGHFLTADAVYKEVEEITKEDLLWMTEKVLQDSVEMDEYDEEALKNQAHQVVYKSLYKNFKALMDRKEEFKDESERLFLEDYKRYVEEVSQQDGGANSDSAPVVPPSAPSE